jgi:hypothetical protein
MNQPLMFKLHQEPNGLGLRCDKEGLFLAGVPLLERDRVGRFQPRSQNAIKKILNNAYNVQSDWASRVRSADVVAKALNNDDLARATMAAVLMRLPEPERAVVISGGDVVLAKAGFNPGEPRDNHGRWARDGDHGAQLISAHAALGIQYRGSLYLR